jgi:hypothetical protein
MKFLALLLCCANIGFAEVLKKEGFVKNVGFSGQSVANIGDGADLCPTGKGEQAKNFSGFMISVEGTKNSEKKCLEVSKIEVVKSPRGKPVIFGTLKKVESNWVLEGDGGKSYTFKKVPKGMRDLVNKKLLVDAAEVADSPNTWKVVTYMVNPLTE